MMGGSRHIFLTIFCCLNLVVLGFFNTLQSSEPASKPVIDQHDGLNQFASGTGLFQTDTPNISLLSADVPPTPETGMGIDSEALLQLQTGVHQLQAGVEQLGKNLKVTTLDKDWGIAIFGSLTGEMLFAEQRPVIPSGIVLIAPDFGRDTPTFAVHAKQSQLGAAFQGPKIGSFQSSGLLLTYFYGEDYLADQPGFFIVRGYGELKNESWRIAFGTEADVSNPLAPGTLDFNKGQSAGNFGYFRGQFRLEHYSHLGCNAQVTTQLALGNPITTSFNSGVRNLVESNGWPNVDGRIALGLGPVSQKGGVKSRPFELGFSGLVGELRRTGTPSNIYQVWSFGTDLKIAFTEDIGIKGEFFHGQALGNYNAAINQIFNPLTLGPIRSTGGWGEIYVNWTDCLHSQIGY